MNASKTLIRSRHGALQLALGTALAAAATAALTSFAIAQHWTRKVRIQLEIDRCAGRAALELRDHLGSLERSNQTLRALRAAVAASLASGNPGAISAARAATTASARLQDLEILSWKQRQIRWILEPECRSSPPGGLPDLPFRRPPPDLWGDQLLQWRTDVPRQFSIRVRRNGRHSVSFVFSRADERWTASWSPPR
jgi:hypothetical protein